MEDRYYINFHEFNLDRLKNQLETGDVMPARQILKDDIESRFKLLASLGVQNLSDLITLLSTKQKIKKLAQETGLPVEYFVILRREVRSYIPKPVYLREIPGLDKQDVANLAAAGATHSKHIFERAQTKGQREDLSKATGVSTQNLLEIAKLSDLARIRGIGAVFTRLFYESGADTVEKLSGWDPRDLFQAVHTANQEKAITKTVPPFNDFVQYVDIAKDLPNVIEFE